MLLVISSAFAVTQMRIVEAVDDFGDPTGQKFLQLITTDFTYNNSSSSNKEGNFVQFSIFTDVEGIICYAVPYSYIETYYDDKISISYKIDNGNAITLTESSQDSYTFICWDKNYSELLKALKKGSKIRFVVKGTEYQNDDKLNFTFEYDNAEFNELLSQL